MCKYTEIIGDMMVEKCGLVKGDSCPASRAEYNKCSSYDPEGDWCYYTEPMRRME